MHLTVLRHPLVRFSDVHGGYLEGATLTFKVEYEPELEVTAQDWVAIIPAGSNDLRQFVSFQAAPVHNKVHCGIGCQRRLDMDMDMDTNGNETTAITNDAIKQQQQQQRHTHSICFDPQFAPIPARHFYQLVFVSESKRAIIGRSSLFYVEPNRTYVRSSRIRTMRDTVVRDESDTKKSLVGSCMLRTLFCGAPLFSSPSPPATKTSTHFYEAPPPPYSESSEENVFQTQPTPASNTESTYDYIKRYISDVLKQPILEPDRSVSMYEMGHVSNMNGGREPKDIHEHYQKLMCQLSMSNSSLLRENESFRARFQHLQMLLQDHIDHLHNIYYTLYLNGFSTLQFPDGEKVDLSQFRGIELGLVQREAPSLLRRPEGAHGPLLSPVVLKDDQRSSSQTAVDELSELASTLLRNRDGELDRQNDSSRSQSEHDKEELRVAMLKCITKSKYDDVDDYLQWLNDSSSTASKLSTHRELWNEQLSDVEELERDGTKSDDGTYKHERSLNVEQPQRECMVAADKKKYFRSESEARVPSDPGNNVDEMNEPQHISPKQRPIRHRALSVGCNKMNGFISARQNVNASKKSTPRRSLANLSSMRNTTNNNNNKSPRRNLI